MARAEVLKELLENGSNLVLTTNIRSEVLYELAEIAHRKGSMLTVPTTIRGEVLIDLAKRYGKGITFINGLRDFKGE